MLNEIVHFDYDFPVRTNRIPLKPYIKQHEPGYKLSEMHLHKEYEFLQIYNGAMICVTPDDKLVAEKGDILFLNSYTPHSTYDRDGNVYNNMLQFNSPLSSNSVYRYIVRFSRVSDIPCCVLKNGDPLTETIKSHMNAITHEYTERNSYWNDYVQANILMIIAVLRRNNIISDYIDKKSVEIEKIRPVIEYINENYNNELSTSDLSNIINFNESYFCRLFKNAIGASPLDYLNFVRICKAEHLLRKGASISDAAYQTGFSSLSYFNRVFKKYNHYTPSEYKKISKNTGFEYTDNKAKQEEFIDEKY